MNSLDLGNNSSAWDNTISIAARAIVIEYFESKFQGLKEMQDGVTKVALDSEDSFRYGGVEFNDKEADFLRNHLDLETQTFTIVLSGEDKKNLEWMLGNKIRDQGLGDHAGEILNSNYIDGAISAYFSDRGFTYSNNQISRSAGPFINAMNAKLRQGFKRLLEDALLDHLRFLRNKALQIEAKMKSNLKGECIEFSKLETNLIGGDIRTIRIDPVGNKDMVTLRLLSARVASIDDGTKIKSSIPDEDKLYDDSDALSIFARNNGMSLLSFFFGDEPFEKIEGFTHWGNLILKSGNLKSAVIGRSDIEQTMAEFIRTIEVDPTIGLTLVTAYGEEKAHGLRQFMEFRILSESERAEKLHERTVEQLQGGLGIVRDIFEAVRRGIAKLRGSSVNQ